MLLFGKNIVEKKIKFKQYKKIADNKYSYYFQKIKPNKITIIKKLKSFTIHIIKSSKKNIMLINNKRYSLKGGEVFQFENSFAKIESINSMLEMLIVGTKKSQIKRKITKFTNYKNIYKVIKPWGYELWLNGRHKNYSFKKIFLRKGFRTSLQYHVKKKETNLLYNGTAKLIYKKNPKVSNLRVKEKDLGNLKIKSISKISVNPNTLHRIKAISNLTLYEASTPELDDVIRVSDDSKRSNGLIKKEHRN